MNCIKWVLSIFLLNISIIAQAQNAQQQALNEIGLTTAEIEAVRTTNEKFKTEAKAVRKNAALNRQAKGKQLRQLQQSRKAQIKDIMGEERYAEFQKVAAENRDAQKENRDAAMDELNLSDDQKADLKAVNEKYRKATQVVRQNGNLTTEQKKQQSKELRQAHLSDMRAVLTAEQYEKYRAMKKAKRQQ
ncbi:MAG: hypothetical protein AAGI23_17525 [Bacteroidota bacterium]